MVFAATLTPFTDANPCPRVLVVFAPTTRTNLCSNPVPTTTTGYSGPGTTSVATMSDGVTPCFSVTTTTATTPYAFSAKNANAVNSGDTYVLSAMVEVLGDSAAATYTVRGHGTTGNVYFASGSQTIQTDATGAVAPQRITLIVTPNAAVAAGEFDFTIVRTGTATGVTVRVGNVLIEKASTFLGYFAGSTAGNANTTYAWTGTANASPSTQTVGFATGTQSINVYRTAEGRTFKVRGGVNLFAVGGAQVMDYECPFGIPATYQAEQFDVNGASLGFTDSVAVTLNVTQTWIHQPLSPSLAVTVKILMDSANDFMRPSPGSTVWPEGAVVGRTIGGQRQGLVQMPLHVKFASAADADEFSSMFGGYVSDFPSVLCIRTPPVIRIPRLLFASCLQPHELVGGVNRLLTAQMVIDEVAPPSPGLLLPALRREDIDAAYPTRAARAAAYATRLARDTDYSKAGLAG